MNKLLSLLLTLILLTLGTTAFAEAVPDLTALSSDALLALLADVQSEVVARRLDKSAQLLAGAYVGGRDVPVGIYLLSPNGTSGDADIVYLRAVDDPADGHPSKLYAFVRGTDDYTAYIHIEEGDILKLPFPFTLTICPGVMFN